MRRLHPTPWLAASVLLTAGCASEVLDLPAPSDPELQASIVATRYMGGDYPDAIDSTRDRPHAIYHWNYTQGVTLWAFLLSEEASACPLRCTTS